MIVGGDEGDRFGVGSEDLDLGSAVGSVAGLIFCFGFHGELKRLRPILGGGVFPSGRRHEGKSKIRGGRLREKRDGKAAEKQSEGRHRKNPLEHLRKVGAGGGIGEWQMRWGLSHALI